MFRKLSLGAKIIAGYLIIIGFVAVTGLVGYTGIKNVAKSLIIVGDEEAPLVDMAMEMKLSLMEARNTMEEFKSASSALASDDEGSLEGICQDYQRTLDDFDKFADAILQGATFEDGMQIIKTDNQALADLVRQSDQIHNDKFQVSASRMMNKGRDLLGKKTQRDKAMMDLENVFDEVLTDAEAVEVMISKEIADRATAGNIGTEARAILREEVPLADMAMEAKLLLAETRTAVEELAQTRDLDEINALKKNYREKIEGFDLCIQAILKGATVDNATIIATDNEEIKAAVQEMDRNHSAFQEAAENLFSAQNAMIIASQEVEKSMEELDGFGEEVDALLGRVEVAASDEMAEAKQSGKVSVSTSVAWIIVTLCASLGLGILIGILLTRSITKPVNRIIASLSEGAEQVGSASQQVSSASQSLAEGASEQASSLEETSSSLEEMSSMTKQNAENANQANNLAAEASNSSEKGGDSMAKMSDAIQEIKKSSDETAKIIKVIDEIAFQTNLLALNAAVEAARAGEAGKGFAVVAEEVRNLAMRSAEAAKNTSSLIEESRENADNGVKVSEEVTAILGEITTGIKKVTDLVSEVAAASNEQAQGISQVNTAVTQIDQVTQQNASNAEESASASEELSAQAAQLQNIVGELTEIVKGAGKESEKQTHQSVHNDHAIRPHTRKDLSGLKNRLHNITKNLTGDSHPDDPVPVRKPERTEPDKVIRLEEDEKELAQY